MGIEEFIKVDTILNSSAIAKLKAISKHPYNVEEDNASADDILCELLTELNYRDVVLEYKKIKRLEL